MKKILLSLIHYGDYERLAYMRPALNRLASNLREKYEVEIGEFYHQPEIEPVTLRVALLKDIMYWRLNRAWMKYKQHPVRLWVTDALLTVLHSAKKYLNRSAAEKWMRMSAIEMYLTEKHARAFKRTLEGNFDYIISFEDDAIFQDDSIDRVVSLIDQIEQGSGTPIYVDLAGGCSLKELRYEQFEKKREDGFIHYSRPVTNTACVYLANRAQIALFDKYLTARPILRYLVADWILNKLFILQLAEGIHSECRHAFPHVFKQGSHTGERKSSIR